MQQQEHRESQNLAAGVCLLVVLVLAGGSYAAAESLRLPSAVHGD